MADDRVSADDELPFQDRHADLDAGELGAGMTDADYYDRISASGATDDRVSAELAAIRAVVSDRQRLASGTAFRALAAVEWHATNCRSADQVPRLLAAVEAALARHEPGPVTIVGRLCKRHDSYRYFSISAAESADVEACPACQAAVWVSCAGCGRPTPLESCPTRAAIERALTGEDPQ